VILIVILTIAEGMAARFRAYEQQAAIILARHGAAIERIIAIAAPPREVHIVRFPDEAALAAYRADPALAALAPERAAVIAATELLIGTDGPID
jgi:uncharacterized protein (DUF1330 family)